MFVCNVKGILRYDTEPNAQLFISATLAYFLYIKVTIIGVYFWISKWYVIYRHYLVILIIKAMVMVYIFKGF